MFGRFVRFGRSGRRNFFQPKGKNLHSHSQHHNHNYLPYLKFTGFAVGGLMGSYLLWNQLGATAQEKSGEGARGGEVAGGGVGGGERKEGQSKGGEMEQNVEPPKKYDYVIVGSGIAARAAVSNLLDSNPSANILWVRKETISHHFDVDAPAPEKYVEWQNKMRYSFWEPDVPEVSDNLQIYNSSGFWVDSKSHQIYLRTADDKIDPVSYGKCLLAVDSQEPTVSVPLPSNNSHIVNCASIADLDKLDYLLNNPQLKHVTVLGGNALATDITTGISYFAKEKNIKVAQLTSQNNVIDKQLPKYLVEQIERQAKKAGVETLTRVKLLAIDEVPNDNTQNQSLVPYSAPPQYSIKLDNGSSVNTNLIVIATEPLPNYIVQLSRFETDENNLLMVNKEMQIATDVWGAGDSVSVWSPERFRKRVTNWEQSYYSGVVASENMLGKQLPFSITSRIRNEIYGNNAVFLGRTESSLETAGVWLNDTEKENEFKKGFVYYLNDSKEVVGITFWNIPEKLVDTVLETPWYLSRAVSFKKDLSKLKTFISLVDE